MKTIATSVVLLLWFLPNLFSQFAFALPEEGIETASDLALDQDGNVFVIGSFSGDTDFDPSDESYVLNSTSPTSADQDVYVASYDPEGNLRFAFHIPVHNYFTSASRGIEVDPAGNIYIAGQLGGEADFDPSDEVFNLGSLSATGSIFVASYTNDGNFRFAIEVENVNGQGFPGELDIKIDGNENLYLSGYFNGQVDFDPGPDVHELTSPGTFSTFLASYQSDGTFRFVKDLGIREASAPPAMELDADGNIVILGQFVESIDVDPGPGMVTLAAENGGDAAYVARYDQQGQLIDAFIFAEHRFIRLLLTIDLDNNLYIAGYYSVGTVDFDPGPETFELNSLFSASFLVSYTVDGQFRYGFDLDLEEDSPMVDEQQTRPTDLTIDADGNYYITGSLRGKVDFDKGPGVVELSSESPNTLDIYLVSYNDEGAFRFATKLGAPDLTEAESIWAWPRVIIGQDLNPIMTGTVQGDLWFNPTTQLYEAGAGAEETSLNVFLANFSVFGGLTEIYEPVKDHKQFNIYPNPAYGEVMIQVNEELDNGQLLLFDQLGQQVGEYPVTGSTLRLSVESLPAGLYTLFLRENGRNTVSQLLVQKAK